jgi:hypothetical protein
VKLQRILRKAIAVADADNIKERQPHGKARPCSARGFLVKQERESTTDTGWEKQMPGRSR